MPDELQPSPVQWKIVSLGELWMYTAAADFSRFALSQGYSPASLAVAWVGHHPAVTAPIIGTRNLTQLEDSLKSVEIEMTDELYKQIYAFTPKPAVATDRTEERWFLTDNILLWN